jgi:hypothetical protein
MAEVQVFGGSKGVTGLKLISKKKPTKASSVGWGGVPARAVDGNVDGVWGHRTSYCSRVRKNNWWQVDLQGKYPVYMVLIHNRVDKCCRARIHGAKVKLCTVIKLLNLLITFIKDKNRLSCCLQMQSVSNIEIYIFPGLLG